MIAGAIGLALLCGTPLVVLPRLLGPDQVVRSYFDALTDRDADRARKLLATGRAVGQPGPIAGLAAEADLSLLTSETLRSSGYTPPRNVEITTTAASIDGSATVQVSYDFGGPATEVTLPVIRDRAAGRFGAWRITDGLLEVALAANVGHRLVVGGTTLPIPSGTARAVVAFPGAYRVTIPENPLLQAQPVTAFAGSPNVVTPSPIEVRPAVRQQVEQQIRNHVDSCARSTVPAPPGCPSVVPRRPVTDVSWQITRYPEWQLKVVDANTATVETLATGVAVMTASPTPGAGPLEEFVGIEVRGTVRVVDGRTVFTIER